MRRGWLALLVLSGCGGAPQVVAPQVVALAPFSEAWLLAQTERYLDSPAARRDALERSLRSPENLYSRLRLGAYGLGSLGWDLLPEWNPRVLPATRATGESR